MLLKYPLPLQKKKPCARIYHVPLHWGWKMENFGISCFELKIDALFILYVVHMETGTMTMESYGDSDIESFSETSSDDQDDIFSIYSGHAQSILSSLEDSIEKIDDFLSFERGFTYGDIVRSTGNPSGQMGKVVGLKMHVDLENLFGEVIKDVNSEKLLRMRSILVGDYVIHSSWLGRVEKVVDNVGILLDDGTKCKIMATNDANLIPLSPSLLDDSLYPYHPGQRVKVGQTMMSKPGGWFCGMSKKSQHEGTVFSVEVGLLYIDWISCSMVGSSVTLPPPTRLQLPENVTLLSCFLHANWQLGDWCILESERGTNKRELNPNFDEMFSILKKKTKVDVMWQDGNFSFGLDSHSLFPVSVLNAHDFFPEQFVWEKTSSEDLSTPFNRKWGLVRCMDANERTVKVKWESMNVGVTQDLIEGKMMEETVSAYELVEHPDFSFNIADIVFMADTNPFARNTMQMEDMNTLGSKNCGANMSDTRRKCFLSSIGYVVGFENGAIKVKWASGVTTKVLNIFYCYIYGYAWPT